MSISHHRRARIVSGVSRQWMWTIKASPFNGFGNKYDFGDSCCTGCTRFLIHSVCWTIESDNRLDGVISSCKSQSSAITLCVKHKLNVKNGRKQSMQTINWNELLYEMILVLYEKWITMVSCLFTRTILISSLGRCKHEIVGVAPPVSDRRQHTVQMIVPHNNSTN